MCTYLLCTVQYKYELRVRYECGKETFQPPTIFSSQLQKSLKLPALTFDQSDLCVLLNQTPGTLLSTTAHVVNNGYRVDR